MIPSKLDLTFWRGTSFDLELISQVKVFVYDPTIHNGPADLKRTHLENLEHYGFVYEYIDFATKYDTAELKIVQPWSKQGDVVSKPLMTLSLANNDIELTDKSVKVGLSAAATKLIKFDSGSYELLLTTPSGKVDGLLYGPVTVMGSL